MRRYIRVAAFVLLVFAALALAYVIAPAFCAEVREEGAQTTARCAP